MTMALGHVRAAAAGQERDMGAEEADEPLKNLGGTGEARGRAGAGVDMSWTKAVSPAGEI